MAEDKNNATPENEPEKSSPPSEPDNILKTGDDHGPRLKTTHSSSKETQNG